jgi:hypothetical protein
MDGNNGSQLLFKPVAKQKVFILIEFEQKRNAKTASLVA